MVTETGTLKNTLALSIKSTWNILITPQISLLGIDPRKHFVHIPRDTDKNVPCSTVCKTTTLEGMEMPFDRKCPNTCHMHAKQDDSAGENEASLVPATWIHAKM